MKILFIFLIACGAALGADLLLGKWKEDENKRQNLSNFLKARGKFFIFPSQLYYYLILVTIFYTNILTDIFTIFLVTKRYYINFSHRKCLYRK